MSKEDKPAPSPVHGLFDATNNLLGPPPLGAGLSPGALQFPALAHLPAFPFLGHTPGFPHAALFGSLGGLPSPLLGHGPSPITGGADWWRGASEQARRLADGAGLEVYAGSLGSLLRPTFAPGFDLPTQSGLECLLRAPINLDHSSLLSGMKHLAEASAASSPPSKHHHSSSSRSKTSKSSSSPSASSSSARSLLNGRGPLQSIDGRKRKQKSSSSSSRPPSSGTPSPAVPSSSPSATSVSSHHSLPPTESPLAAALSQGAQDLRQRLSSTSSPSHKKKKRDSSSEKNSGGSHTQNGGHTELSSISSSISDDSSPDNLSSDEFDKKAGSLAIQIDGLKKKLLADQIRQRVQVKPKDSHSSHSPTKEHSRKHHKEKSHSQLKEQLLQSELRHDSHHHAHRSETPSSDATPEHRLSDASSPAHSSTGLKIHISKAAIAKHLHNKIAEEMGVANGSDSGGDNSDSSDSDSDNSDDSDDSDSDSEGEEGNHGDKNEAVDNGSEATPAKKRKIVTDEKDLRIPLEHGWRRQTTILAMGRRGIVGEVLYFAPCGKKMKTIPDVMRYLDRNGITDLSRDNFTFNTKVNVGEFSEMRHGEVMPVPLAEAEVLERIAMSKGKRARMKELAAKRKEKAMKQQELAKHFMEIKLKRKLEQQDLARKAAEIKFQKRLDLQRQKEYVKKSKVIKAVERRKQKEQLKMAKHQEKVRRQEQIRQEREMRAQQILEEREVKRQQAMLLREQVMKTLSIERERRRQHLLLVKALEARKKQEEKEKMKVEKLQEKRMFREKKMEQRRMELEFAREMKRPCEDMELKDEMELPEIARIPGVQMCGSAFADCLMAVEFMHNFGDALGLDKDSIPTMKILQNALMNDNDEDMEEYMSLLSHLLRFALNDPGVPCPKEAVTKLNQKIVDLDPTDSTLSEILRIFIIARNGRPTEMSGWLEVKPLESLNATQKAAILAFVCDELLGSRSISGEVDKNIETINTLRRDKWLVEGKLRQLRMIQAKKFRKGGSKPEGDTSSSQANMEEDATNLSMSKHGSDDEEDKLEDEEEKEEESGNESDSTNATNITAVSEEEEDGLTVEECDKKIEKLTKQHSLYRNKVFDASHRLRGLTLGQDRYKRRFWILPYSGGIFLEGLESSHEVYDDNPELVGPKKKTKEEESDVKEESEKDGEKEVKKETDVKTEEDAKTETDGKSGAEVKSEKVEDSEELDKILQKDSENDSAKEVKDVKKEEGEKIPNGDSENVKSESESKEDVNPENVKTESPEDLVVKENGESDKKEKGNCKIDTSLFLQKADINKLSDILKIPKREAPKDSSKVVNNIHTSLKVPSPILTHSTSLVSSTPVTSPCPTSPSHKTETKHNFTSIDSLLKKETDNSSDSQSNNHFLPPNLFPPSPLIKDHHINNYTDILEQRPWFSILPRMPCDENSLTRTPHSNSSPAVVSNTSLSSFFPFMPFSPSSPNFGTFQVGNSSLDSSMISNSDASWGNLSSNLSSNLTPGLASFKVPPPPCDTPSSCTGSVAMEMLKPVVVEPTPIPEEMQLNWWRITDDEQVKELLRCLHNRGIREKNLMKKIQTHMEYTYSCAGKGNPNVLKFDGKKECNSPAKSSPSKGKSNKDPPLPPPPKKWKTPVPDDPDSWSADANLEVEMGVLEEVEALEERIFSASLQVKASKMPAKATEDTSLQLVSRSVTDLKDNQRYPLDVARARLLQLEANIERRYLKPPLIRRNVSLPANIATMSSPNGEQDEDAAVVEENIPPGLVLWRKALVSTTSCAQLMLCLLQLNNAISWEKSIMKVICQICRKDDNEAELLLCDGCDKGYHTYCFKPKMENIPDGDWYCYECISKASGFPHCIVCGKKMGKIVECDHCPRAIHIDCLDPPLPRIPKKYACAVCSVGKKPKRVRKKRPSETRERKESESGKTEPPGSAEKKKKESSSVSTPKGGDKDLVSCGKILLEMEKHDQGWPFLQPVNTKKFPSYKKYIKTPMDFSTMRIKIRDSVYKSRQEFATDARTVFNNCETFNEDDSEVGQAGHTMRKFFDKRFKDLFGEDS